MNRLFLVLFFVSTFVGCKSQDHSVKIKLKENYYGWVFIIETTDQIIKKENDFFLVEDGVVYIPKILNDSVPTKFALFDSNLVEISKNVRLFSKAKWSKANSKEGKNYFVFYYPTVQELNFDKSFWLDFSSVKKYNDEKIKMQRELEKKGILN
jgi:hypothetical protein